MTAYAFEAIDAQGQTRKGVLDADSAKAARTQLRAQALVPLAVQALGPESKQTQSGSTSLLRRIPRVFSAIGLTIWTRQLAGLVAAGLPLERALASLSQEAEQLQERDLVATLRSEVNGGAPFARALSQHPREFSDIYVAVVGAGEQSGHLGLVLERLADDLEEQQTLGRRPVSRHCVCDCDGDCAVFGDLCGAASRPCVCQQQARAAHAHGHHDGYKQCGAQLWLAHGAGFCRRYAGRPPEPC
jgi:type II secretory pathway component PulF